MDLSIDYYSFAKDIDDLGHKLRKETNIEDHNHIVKLRYVSWFFAALGYATAFIPNPISVFLIAQHMVGDFLVGHHVGHKAYDSIPGIEKNSYHSNHFGQGWRRFRDWFTWFEPIWWNHMHNHHHHGHTQNPLDADLMDSGTFSFLPMPARYIAGLFYACTWQFTYYAPYLQREYLRRHEKRVDCIKFDPVIHLLNFKDPVVRSLWINQYMPYVALKFILFPMLFLPLGWWAVSGALITMILAEILSNIQTFICNRSSHYAPDISTFSDSSKGRVECIVRQFYATTNYTSKNDFYSFLQVFNTHHIEHHLWPAATVLQLKKAKPAVKLICKKYGVPYLEQSILVRFRKMMLIYVGKTTQPIMNTSLLRNTKITIKEN